MFFNTINGLGTHSAIFSQIVVNGCFIQSTPWLYKTARLFLFTPHIVFRWKRRGKNEYHPTRVTHDASPYKTPYKTCGLPLSGIAVHPTQHIIHTKISHQKKPNYLMRNFGWHDDEVGKNGCVNNPYKSGL